MPTRRAKIAQSDLEPIFKVAAKYGYGVHIRAEPDGALDVQAMPVANVPDNGDTPEKILELIGNGKKTKISA